MGFGLKLDQSDFARRDIFSKWHAAFHGTTKQTVPDILTGKWDLAMPGDTLADPATGARWQLPIRKGHIAACKPRHNLHTDATELFDPKQIFTSKSITYSGLEFYCAPTEFKGRSFLLAFEVRQQPGTYSVGQETLGATRRGKIIDPLFSNNELEYYTQARGVHALQRLLVRVLDDVPPEPDDGARSGAAVMRAPGARVRAPPWHDTNAATWLPLSVANGAETELRWRQEEGKANVLVSTGSFSGRRRSVPLAWLLLPTSIVRRHTHSTPNEATRSELQLHPFCAPEPVLCLSAHALNAPGHWDVFIGHSRRCAEAVLLATELRESFERRGLTVWFDVRMRDKSVAAMEEGVKNARVVIAVITGPCVNSDSPRDDPESNSYFRRNFCVQELRWAKEAGVPIQPVLRNEDKSQISEFLALAPDDMKDLGNVDWVDLNRNDPEYWEVGIKKVIRAIDKQQRIRKLAR